MMSARAARKGENQATGKNAPKTLQMKNLVTVEKNSPQGLVPRRLIIFGHASTNKSF